MSEMHFYEPAKGHGLKHDPFNAIVGPRPIGWIASKGVHGLNLAPYSFFNAFNYHPPIIGFSSVGAKDTLRNISKNGEFVWNLATKPLAERMNLTSAALPPEQDEFHFSGLTPAPSRLIGVPRVAESPVAFECRMTQCIRLTTKEGREVNSWLTLGEVVAVHIDESLLENGIYNTAKAAPILRAGGPGDYCEITPERMFTMLRPEMPAKNAT